MFKIIFLSNFPRLIQKSLTFSRLSGIFFKTPGLFRDWKKLIFPVQVSQSRKQIIPTKLLVRYSLISELKLELFVHIIWKKKHTQKN